MQFGNLLARYLFEQYVLDICIATLTHGGTTTRIDTRQFLTASTTTDAWGIPKHPDRTVILSLGANLPEEIIEFIRTNEYHLKEPDCWLGTWIHPQTHHCYLDITTVFNRFEDARQYVSLLNTQEIRRKIVAIYDFKQGCPVYL